MKIRDGDLVRYGVRGEFGFYRGYTSCPHCYGKTLEKVEKQNKAAIAAAMKRRSHKEAT